MQPWFIPMFYVSGAVLGGLALPRIEHAYLSAYTIGLSVASAQAFLSAVGFGHDGADRDHFRHGFRDGAIQRDRLFPSARALVRARPDAVPRAGRVHGDFCLCAVHARLGGPRRLGKGPAVLDAARRDHDRYQHAPVFEVDAAPRRPSDRQRPSPGWRPGARRDRRDVSRPGRCVRRPSSCQKRGEHGAARPRDPNGEVCWRTPHRRQARRRFPRHAGARRAGRS